MPIGAAISVGGGLINAGIGAYSANKSSKAMQAAAAQAAAAQKQQMEEAWNRASGVLSPFSNVGRGAMMSLGQLYGIQSDGSYSFNNAMGQDALDAFRRSPDYQFASQEGMRNLTNSNSATGLLRSSDHLRSAIQFNQGLATQNFGNYQTNLRNLATMGLDASKSLGTVAAGIGNNPVGAQAILAGGQAAGAGIMGVGNALMGGINSTTNALTAYNAYTRNNSAYGNTNPNMPGGAGDPARYGNLPMPVYGNTAYNFDL